MTDNNSQIKEIIRKALTEEYTKENNKVFTLSDNTIQRYNIVQQFLNFIQIKELDEIAKFLSDNPLINGELVDKKFAIEKLTSAISFHFSKIESRLIDIKVTPSMGGDLGFNDCIDCPEKIHLFIVPWKYQFLCRVFLDVTNESNSFDFNYFIEFDDDNKISMVDFYIRNDRTKTN